MPQKVKVIFAKCFFVALFILAKHLKYSICLLLGEWLNYDMLTQ